MREGVLPTPLPGLHAAALLLCLVLPWLNPFASGPSPGVVPWLVTLAGVAGLRLLLPGAWPRAVWVGAAAGLAAVMLLRSVSSAGHNLLTVAVLLTMLMGAAVGRQAAHRPWLLKVVLAGWLLAGGISSGVALLQYTGLTGALLPWVNGTALGEAFGNLRQRNQFATLTSIALVALCVAVGARVPRTGGGGVSWATVGWATGAVLLALLLAAGNAASASRTGLAQWGLLALLFAVWGAWRVPAVRGLLLWALVAYAFAVWALPLLIGEAAGSRGLLARLADGAPSCTSRKALWSNVLELVALKPWLGWGWGGLDQAHYLTLYSGQRFCDILDNAHNLPLHLAVELGVPVAVLVCGAFGWAALAARPWRAGSPVRQLGWGVLAVLLLHSGLEYPLWYGPFALAFGIALGIVWPGVAPDAAAGPSEANFKPNQQSALVKSGASAIVLVAFIGWVAWDYWRVSQVYLPSDSRHPAYQTDTLAKVRNTWWFSDPVQFAELTLTPLTRANAAQVAQQADALLSYSPEVRVIEKRIEAAALLGDDAEALRHMARYRAAFPEAYAKWARANVLLPRLLEQVAPASR